jgi:hypothetical protein
MARRRRGRHAHPAAGFSDLVARWQRGQHLSRKRWFRDRPWYLAGAVIIILGLTMNLSVGAVAPRHPALDHPALDHPKLGHHQPASGRPPLQLGSSARLYISEMTALQKLKLLNYYPARSSWTHMWDDFEARTIDQDMARMAGLHANGVRIIISTAAFGFPKPHRWALADLRRVVRMARSHGLRVQLTLFDGFGGWSDIQGSQKWADAVLAPYEGNDEIAFIELRNEIDPADPAQMTWCRDLLRYLEARARGVPVTVSVTNGVSTLTGLRDRLAPIRPNFWDFHFYGPAGAAYATFAAARAAVGPSPLYIGEFGFSTWLGNASSVAGLPRVQGDLDAYQAYYYTSVEAATHALGLPAAAPWTVYDFSRPGAPPQPSPSQYQYGIYDLNGSPKPAAGVIKRFFSTGQVNTSFNQDFAQSVGTPGDSLPALWQLSQPGGGTFAWDKAVAYAGRPSARLSGTAATCPAYSVTPPNGFVLPGQSVSVSVQARAASATGANGLSLVWMNAQGAPIDQAGRPFPAVLLGDGTKPWTTLQARATAPAGAAYLEIDLVSCTNQGTVWFAGVRFAPASVAAGS